MDRVVLTQPRVGAVRVVDVEVAVEDVDVASQLQPNGIDIRLERVQRVTSPALLGASDTVARNASGLTAEGSHSSARDLVLLLRAALADETGDAWRRAGRSRADDDALVFHTSPY